MSHKRLIALMQLKKNPSYSAAIIQAIALSFWGLENAHQNIFPYVLWSILTHLTY